MKETNMSTDREVQRLDVRYELLRDCACGPEELFVLVTTVDWADPRELHAFLETMSGLIEAGLLESFTTTGEGRKLATVDLLDYVSRRRAAGEDLDQPPAMSRDLTFFTTELGLTQLREEDRPERAPGNAP